jgi:hypothetical protein
LLINKEIIYKYYLAIRNGEYNEHFFEKEEWHKESFEISKNLPKLPKEITMNDFYLVSGIDTIKPKNNIDFKGKIFLLVNKVVFSSAEGFAVFCKSTKWATVVGETTSGDGVGIDPIIVCLPTSKILIRYPGEMGLNPDGSSNEEVNTIPDIKIDGRSSEERLFNFAKTINPNIEYLYHDIPPILNNCKVNVIIYPTNESTDKLNIKIIEQVKSFNKRFFLIPDSLVIPDTIALHRKFINMDILCWGSIYGNLWIKEHLKDFPIEITADYIRAKEIHMGDNLRLIASWFNTDSEGNYVRFYTAQKSEEVLNLFDVFHGPTNYAIADYKYEPIENGNYIFNKNTKKYEIEK